MPVQYTNNAKTTLATTITSIQTTLVVASGDGGLFPHTTGGTTFPITIVDAIHVEICNCTNRSGDVLTVDRAVEGTQGYAFNAGVIIECRITAGSLDDRFDELLRKDGNLSGLADVSAARQSLGLEDSATQTIQQIKKTIINELYPVGGPPYIAVNDPTSPEVKWPWMTWHRMKDGFLYPQGAPDSGAAGDKGGSSLVQLLAKHIPRHRFTGKTTREPNHTHSYSQYGASSSDSHSGPGGSDTYWRGTGPGNVGYAGGHDHDYTTDYFGDDEEHENKPPFVTVYMWERVS